MNTPVAIAIPIFNARELTERCIESVLEHAPASGWRLILVDDASSEPGLGARLGEFAARDPRRISLLVNERNQGFTASANRAMRALLPGEDLLLLNSDTEVFAGFLARLQAAASADERNGIVTPFSNNATLCSVPEPFQDNPIPPGYSPASFDRLIAACSLRERPEIVTAVGFCMYVKSAVLADTGLFNESVYGRGFGEENDLCELAKRHGWSIRLCDDLFVWHKGKASFGDEGRARERANLALLEGRHPGYLRAVQQFAHDNPLAPLHARLRFHLPRLSAGRESAMLFLLHASPYQQRPGGTEHHVYDLVQRLALPRAVIAWPERDELVAAEILAGEVARPRRFELRLRSPSQQFCLSHPEIEQGLRSWIRAFGIRAAHVHHTLRWPASILRVLDEEGAPFIFTAHDFHLACPNWNLFDESRGAACPCDGSQSCEQSCLRTFAGRPDLESPAGGVTAIGPYRDAHRAALAHGVARARAIVFPSQSAQDELRKRGALPPVPTRVVENGYSGDSLRAVAAKPPPHDGALRVLILGETGLAPKGAENYLRVAAALRGADIQLHFIGESARRLLQPELTRLGLAATAVFHGRVERANLPASLASIAPHVGLLLPAMMETFSYVVSELALAGIPLVVNPHGASAERVRAHGFGVIVADADAAADQLRTFARDRSPLAPLRARALAYRHPSLEESAAAVRALYAEAGLLDALSSVQLPSAADLEALFLQCPDASACAAPLEARPVESIVRAEPPASAYQGGVAYQLYSIVKRWVPAGLRRWSRDQLLRRQYQPRLIFDPAQARLRDLALAGSGWGEARFSVAGPFPLLSFPIQALRLGAAMGLRLGVLRFRLLHNASGNPRARILWRNGEGETLSDDKALRLVLAREPGQWHDYVVLLNESPQWKRGLDAGLVELALEVANAGQDLSVGPLELG